MSKTAKPKAMSKTSKPKASMSKTPKSKVCNSKTPKNKICNGPLCKGAWRPITDFNWLNKALGKLEFQCRNCRKIYKRKISKSQHRKRINRKFTYGDTRVCLGPCGKERPIEEFWLRSKKSGEREARCSECRMAAWDKEKRKEMNDKWRKTGEGQKILKANRKKYKPIFNERRRERYNTDIDYKIKVLMRNRINDATRPYNIHVKGKIKHLGIELDIYKKWIEFQFDENMSWDNYGPYWNIDHVRPCDSFKFKDENDPAISECFNWKNTRPMYGPANLSKGAKIDTIDIARHAIVVGMFQSEYGLDSDFNGLYYKTHSDKILDRL